MPKIALVTDSTCDLPEAQQSRHRPVVVPLHFAMGGVSYLDRVDMDSATFYKRFRENGQVAHSSQPSVGEFVNIYSALLARPRRRGLGAHLWSSVRHRAERLGSRRRGGHAHECAWSIHGTYRWDWAWWCRQQARPSRPVPTSTAVVAAAEAAAGLTRVYGALPELEVAVKGGRVSAPAAMLAGLIELKPLIVFDEEGGTHIAGARLGYRRALQAVADKVVRYAAGGPVRVVIVHADGPESAQLVQASTRVSARGHRRPHSAGGSRHHHARGTGHRRRGRAAPSGRRRTAVTAHLR